MVLLDCGVFLLLHVELRIQFSIIQCSVIHKWMPGSSFNPNSLDNKGSWRILKGFYCSVTMLRELGIMQNGPLNLMNWMILMNGISN